MSFDTNVEAPAESPEQKAARERAEAQAEARDTAGLQTDLKKRTRELLRLFGLNAATNAQFSGASGSQPGTGPSGSTNSGFLSSIVSGGGVSGSGVGGGGTNAGVITVAQ